MLGLLVAAGMDLNQVNESNESASGILRNCHGLTVEEALGLSPANGDEPKFPEGMDAVAAEHAKGALSRALRGAANATLDKAWLADVLRTMNFEAVLGHRFGTFVDLVFHRMDAERHGTLLKPKNMAPTFTIVYTLHQIHLFKGLVPPKDLAKK